MEFFLAIVRQDLSFHQACLPAPLSACLGTWNSAGYFVGSLSCGRVWSRMWLTCRLTIPRAVAVLQLKSDSWSPSSTCDSVLHCQFWKEIVLWIALLLLIDWLTSKQANTWTLVAKWCCSFDWCVWKQFRQVVSGGIRVNDYSGFDPSSTHLGKVVCFSIFPICASLCWTRTSLCGHFFPHFWHVLECKLLPGGFVWGRPLPRMWEFGCFL